MILKKIGKQFQVLNLVETHTKYETEVSIKRRFPGIEFFFNLGPPQSNRESHKEGCKGTLIALQQGILKVKNFQIHVQGRLLTLDLTYRADHTD